MKTSKIVGISAGAVVVLAGTAALILRKRIKEKYQELRKAVLEETEEALKKDASEEDLDAKTKRVEELKREIKDLEDDIKKSSETPKE